MNDRLDQIRDDTQTAKVLLIVALCVAAAAFWLIDDRTDQLETRLRWAETYIDRHHKGD